MPTKVSEEFLIELARLIKKRGGEVHRDEAFQYFLEETKFDKEKIRQEFHILEAKNYIDDRGMIRGKEETFDTKHYEGDVSELQLTPGQHTGENYHGLPILEEEPHPLMPSQESYFERELTSSGVTDVEILCRAMADPDFSPLLIGDAGTGKDALVLHMCSMTNRPVVRVNFGSDIRYEDLVGMYVIEGESENDAEEADSDDDEMLSAKMRWRDGKLTAAVRYGWTFIADEINAAPPESTMPLHQVTEEGDKAKLALRGKNEIVEPHPHFRFIATMNPPRRGYGGTNQLNDAFKSRFYSIEIDYLQPDKEIKLVEQQYGDSVSQENIKNLCQLAHRLRQQYKQSELNTPVTTRELFKICKLSEIMPVKEATQMVLLGHAQESDQDLLEEAIETYF